MDPVSLVSGREPHCAQLTHGVVLKKNLKKSLFFYSLRYRIHVISRTFTQRKQMLYAVPLGYGAPHGTRRRLQAGGGVRCPGCCRET